MKRTISPELKERVIIEGSDLLIAGQTCADRFCDYKAKYVMLAPYGPNQNKPEPVCGTHKNERLTRWAEQEYWERLDLARKRREAELSVRQNVALFLTDQLGVTINAGKQEGFTFDEEVGQRLYQCGARIVYDNPNAMKVEIDNG